MEQIYQNNVQNQNQTSNKSHHHHRKPSNKKSSAKRIYQTLFLLSGLTLIILSITKENLFLAFSGSMLLFISLAFTDVYKNLTRASAKFLSALNKSIDGGKRHSHGRGHRSH